MIFLVHHVKVLFETVCSEALFILGFTNLTKSCIYNDTNTACSPCSSECDKGHG